MMFYMQFLKNLKKLCKKIIIKLIHNEFCVRLSYFHTWDFVDDKVMTITILPYGITEMHWGRMVEAIVFRSFRKFV